MKKIFFCLTLLGFISPLVGLSLYFATLNTFKIVLILVVQVASIVFMIYLWSVYDSIFKIEFKEKGNISVEERADLKHQSWGAHIFISLICLAPTCNLILSILNNEHQYIIKQLILAFYMVAVLCLYWIWVYQFTKYKKEILLRYIE